MKKLINILFSRVAVVGFLILLQIAVLVVVILDLSNYFTYIYALFTTISMCVVVWLMSKRDNPSYKLAWTIPILLFPIFGGLFYMMFGGNKTTSKFRKRMERAYLHSIDYLKPNAALVNKLSRLDQGVANQSEYIAASSTYPIYEKTESTYLTPGEIKFEVLKEELMKAKSFIFMEYFIVEEGIMWGSILDILVKKAAQGVDVRVVYDDIGCAYTLPSNYPEKLKKMGIRCEVFNPFRPIMSFRLNNRDHRKIAVIDGNVGFTGGINLADEYINAFEKHGHWKDAAIMLRGEGVWNLTVMFLQLWGFITGDEENYYQYRPVEDAADPFISDGFVQPYGDSPLDEETVSENVYLNLIGRSKKYLYINTPYLIVDNELVTALCLAAKSGVDVRIVTPGVADKWYVHTVTQAYYAQLVDAGVKIYEYTPGFIHSKTFVSDDELGIVGTINLDYRSLYLHFECGAWLYKTQSIFAIRDDFLQTLELCKQITVQDCRNTKLGKRLLTGVLRAFAPLM